MQPYDQEPITIATSRDFGEPAHWPSETPEKGAGPMRIVVMLEMAEQSKGLIKEATYGERKKKRPSLSSASDGFSTARLSSPLWRVVFYLGHFFLFVSSLFLFIHFYPEQESGIHCPYSLASPWQRCSWSGVRALLRLGPGRSTGKSTRESTPPPAPACPCLEWMVIWNVACEQRWERAVEEGSTSFLALTRQSHWLLLSYNSWISLGGAQG